MKIVSRLLLAFTIVFMLDVLTKTWAEQALSFQRPVSVLGDLFRFTLGYNTGVAFGLFAKGGFGPLIVTGIVIIGLAIWSISALRAGDFTLAAVWPMGLILGGRLAISATVCSTCASPTFWTWASAQLAGPPSIWPTASSYWAQSSCC